MKQPAKDRSAAVVVKKSASPQNVDEYLARLPAATRATLEKLRKTIRAAAPEATEIISYGVPAYRNQRMLVSFGASAKHCAFYVMSPAVMKAHESELRDYDIAKGTIRFPVDSPLPAALVKKLVKARLTENEKLSAR